MPNLSSIKRDIERKYFSTNDTAERYNILKELTDHLNELRQKTVSQIGSGFENCNMADALRRICILLADQSGWAVSTVSDYVKESSTIEDVTDNLSLDSLDLVEFIMAVEEEFDAEISDEDAEKFETIGDIIANVLIRN